MAATNSRKRTAPLDDIAAFGAGDVPSYKRHRTSRSGYHIAANDGHDYNRDQDPDFANRITRTVWRNYALAVSNEFQLSSKVVALEEQNVSLTQQLRTCEQNSRHSARQADDERISLSDRCSKAESSRDELQAKVKGLEEAAKKSAREHRDAISAKSKTIAKLTSSTTQAKADATQSACQVQQLTNEHALQSSRLQEKEKELQYYKEVAQIAEAQRPIARDVSHEMDRNTAIFEARQDENARCQMEFDGLRQDLERQYSVQLEEQRKIMSQQCETQLTHQKQQWQVIVDDNTNNIQLLQDDNHKLRLQLKQQAEDLKELANLRNEVNRLQKDKLNVEDTVEKYKQENNFLRRAYETSQGAAMSDGITLNLPTPDGTPETEPRNRTDTEQTPTISRKKPSSGEKKESRKKTARAAEAEDEIDVASWQRLWLEMWKNAKDRQR